MEQNKIDCIMEIPDSDFTKTYEKASEIAESCTEGFNLRIKTKLLASLLYVRFSKCIPLKEKTFVMALGKLDFNNLSIDCIHDDGRKWKKMNTLLKTLLLKSEE